MANKKSTRSKYPVQESQKPTQNSWWKRAWVIALIGVLFLGAAAAAIFYVANHQTQEGITSGFTISGTINYGGSQPSGRVYLVLLDENGYDTGIGTSLESPQAYSIPSVPSGSYFLKAWMDNTSPQIGVPNAASAYGSISISVNDGDVTGQNITINDPGQSDPTAPSNLKISPGDGSVLVQWAAPEDTYGNILAQSYNVYYSTSSSINSTNSTKKVVQANNHIFISGLTNGTNYYFVVTSFLSGAESPATDVVSVAVGAPTGLNTVSGSISFPGKANGPMYIGLTTATGTLFKRIDQPVSPQPYSISGVPTGYCVPFVFIDMNNDGTTDIGDLSTTASNSAGSQAVVTVSGDVSGIDQSLSDAHVLAKVVTVHFGSSSSDLYSVKFEISSNTKLPVKVVLTSGPNAPVPSDLGGNYTFSLLQPVSVKPQVGDTYVFSITYSDGTSEKLRVPVTAVLDSLPQNLSTSGSSRNSPTFNWAAPASPPQDYTYFIQVAQSSVGQEWIYPSSSLGMPSSQTSVDYNIDGTASLTNLITGTTYDWLIYMVDSDGNQGIYQTEYTP